MRAIIANINIDHLNAEINIYTNSGYTQCTRKEATLKVTFKDTTEKVQKTVYFH